MPPAPAPARLEETATFLSKPPRSAQLMATLLSSTGPRAGPVTRHLISRVPSTEPGASARCGRSDGVRWPCEDSGVRPPPRSTSSSRAPAQGRPPCVWGRDSPSEGAGGGSRVRAGDGPWVPAGESWVFFVINRAWHRGGVTYLLTWVSV